MSFSNEAKDFIKTFTGTSQGVYNIARSKRLMDGKLDPVGDAFKKGHGEPDKRPNISWNDERGAGGGVSASAPIETQELEPPAPVAEAAEAVPVQAALTENMAAPQVPLEPPILPMMGGAMNSGGVVRRIQAYFDGGSVGALDEPDDFGYEPPGEAMPVEGAPAAPDPGPAPKRMNDPLLGAAIHGPIMWLQNTFKMNGEGPKEAVPVQGKPARQGGGRLLMSGMGAASQEEYDAIMKIVDPNNELDDGIRNISGIKAVYDYYLKRGNIEGANKAAASLIQYTRNISAKFAGNAEEAIKRGDFKAGAAFLEKAYNNTPDGMNIDVTMAKNGHGFVIQRDEEGNVVDQTAFSPQQMLEAATGMQNGSLFWKQMAYAADQYLGGAGQPTAAYQQHLMSVYGYGPNGEPPAGAAPPAQGAVPGEAPQAAPAPGGEPAPEGEAPGAVTPAGNPEDTPPVKPVRPAASIPDPKMLAKMRPVERTAALRQLKEKDSAALKLYEEQIKVYNEALKAHRAAVSRKALSAASDELYDEDETGAPRSAPEAVPVSKPEAVDTGVYHGPGGAPKATEANPMAVLDQEPAPAPAPPPEPVYKRFKNDPRMSEQDRAQHRAEVRQINAQIKARYDKQYEDWRKADEQRRKDAKSAGASVKPEARGRVEDDIGAAWENYLTAESAKLERGKRDQFLTDRAADAEWIKSAAYGVYANNDFTGREALRNVLSLTTVDKANPRAMNFEAKDTKDGNAVVKLANGVTFKLPMNTFNQLGQIRLQRIKQAQAETSKEAETAKKRAANDAQRKANDAKRQAEVGKPKPRSQVVTGAPQDFALPVDDDAVDKRLEDVGDWIKERGRGIADTVKGAARSLSGDYAKDKR